MLSITLYNLALTNTITTKNKTQNDNQFHTYDYLIPQNTKIPPFGGMTHLAGTTISILRSSSSAIARRATTIGP